MYFLRKGNNLLKKYIIYAVLLILLFVVSIIAVLFLSNYYISSYSKDFIYDHIDDLPHNKAGLLLGTSKYTIDGRINLFFKYRIDAAVSLYRAGKVDYLILSGDNSIIYYNEPMAMRKELLKLGIPDTSIYLDYAGFRTLDAVVRANEIFCQKQYTIISQKFHNERAVFISHKKGLNTIAYNAKAVSKYYGYKTHSREYFARVKVFLDLLIGKNPKFLGEKIPVGKVRQSHMKEIIIEKDTIN